MSHKPLRYPTASPGTLLTSVERRGTVSVQEAFGGKSRYDFHWRFDLNAVVKHHIGDYRVQRNLHRWISFQLFKPWTPDTNSDWEDSDDDEHDFRSDRHRLPSLLLRIRFGLSHLREEFGDTATARLYRYLFDASGDTRLRYRRGPRRPSFLVVGRGDKKSPCVADGSCEIVAEPCFSEIGPLVGQEMWAAASWDDRRAAFAKINLDDDYHYERNPNITTVEQADELFASYICRNHGRAFIGKYIDESLYERKLKEAYATFGVPEYRRALSCAFYYLLTTYELCGAVYSSFMFETYFCRLYLLAPGRIAIERPANCVDTSAKIAARPGIPYETLVKDIRHTRSLTLGHDLHPVTKTYYIDAACTQVDTRQREPLVSINLDSLQVFMNFFTAAVIRLGSLEASQVDTKLPTPIQDAGMSEMIGLLCNMLPPELANRIVQSWIPSVDVHPPLYPGDPITSEESGSDSEASSRTEVDRPLMENRSKDDDCEEGEEGEDSEEGEGDEDGDEGADSDGSQGDSDDGKVESNELNDTGENDQGDITDAASDSPSARRRFYEATYTSYSCAPSASTSRSQYDDDRYANSDAYGGGDLEPGETMSTTSAEKDLYDGLDSYLDLADDDLAITSIVEQVVARLATIVAVTPEEMDELYAKQVASDRERYQS